MKKLIVLTSAVVLMVGIVAVQMVAAKGDNPANDKPNTLYLYEKDTDYTLISYTDPWPGSPVCLAAGTSNNGGNINLQGTVDLGKSEGIKIWLVLSSDVDCDTPAMIGWNPGEYLFEHNLVPNPDI